jgi:hypothetical protein
MGENGGGDLGPNACVSDKDEKKTGNYQHGILGS